MLMLSTRTCCWVWYEACYIKPRLSRDCESWTRILGFIKYRGVLFYKVPRTRGVCDYYSRRRKKKDSYRWVKSRETVSLSVYVCMYVCSLFVSANERTAFFRRSCFFAWTINHRKDVKFSLGGSTWNWLSYTKHFSAQRNGMISLPKVRTSGIPPPNEGNPSAGSTPATFRFLRTFPELPLGYTTND